MLDRLRTKLEAHGFEVISRISDRLGARASRLRLLFIYLSFVTLGATFAIYLFFAFLLWIKDGIIVKRKSVFDL